MLISFGFQGMNKTNTSQGCNRNQNIYYKKKTKIYKNMKGRMSNRTEIFFCACLWTNKQWNDVCKP